MQGTKQGKGTGYGVAKQVSGRSVAVTSVADAASWHYYLKKKKAGCVRRLQWAACLCVSRGSDAAGFEVSAPT